MARKLASLSSRRIMSREELVVTGIVTTEQTPRALIGTEIVEQGQTIMGATVIRITPDSVEFEMDGKRWTQKVRDTEVRE
jgi:type II secretory pathway component PulC